MLCKSAGNKENDLVVCNFFPSVMYVEMIVIPNSAKLYAASGITNNQVD
jgi:hypothetical protein